MNLARFCFPYFHECTESSSDNSFHILAPLILYSALCLDLFGLIFLPITQVMVSCFFSWLVVLDWTPDTVKFYLLGCCIFFYYFKKFWVWCRDAVQTLRNSSILARLTFQLCGWDQSSLQCGASFPPPREPFRGPMLSALRITRGFCSGR